jgi:DNA polymerase-3 subunit epsilon
MGLLNKEIFICLDCETTGLDAKNDRIIEIALHKFTFSETLLTYETLIDPQIVISEESKAIHHISDEMVQGKPKVEEILPLIFQMIERHIIVGHGIQMDISFLIESAKRFNIPCPLESVRIIDTLRLARLYGESPTNSLERLRQHFNIEEEGAHRAMNDVVVNIDVFKYLSANFKTTEQMLERLKSPILLKNMPLGKYKGRPFSEVPAHYLSWAVRADFDQDLIFSVKSELNKRKKGERFSQSFSPFSGL